MKNINSKSRKILLVVVLVALATFYLRPKLTAPIENVPGTKGASYDTLVPGFSSKSDAIEKLGAPLNGPDSPSLEFKSSNPNLPHEVIIANDKVVFIKEIIKVEGGKTSNDIIELYGEALKVLYGPDSIHGFNLYVYPDKGIAYLGHIKEPLLLEIWYFQPTTLQEFKAKWASGYSESYRPIH